MCVWDRLEARATGRIKSPDGEVKVWVGEPSRSPLSDDGQIEYRMCASVGCIFYVSPTMQNHPRGMDMALRGAKLQLASVLYEDIIGKVKELQGIFESLQRQESGRMRDSSEEGIMKCLQLVDYMIEPPTLQPGECEAK